MTPTDPGSASAAARTTSTARRATSRRRPRQLQPAGVRRGPTPARRARAPCGAAAGRELDDAGGHAEARGPAPRRARPACRGGAATPPTRRSPTASCPGRCRRARSPPRSSNAGRPRAAASARGPAPRRGRRGPGWACARGGRPSSSSSTASATRPTGGALGPRAGLSHSSIRLLVGVEHAVGAPASSAASASSVKQHGPGSSAGHSASTYGFTVALRATASCTRSSGESPARLHLQRARRARAAAAASAGPRRSARPATRSSSSDARCTSYAGTRHFATPRGTTSASVGAAQRATTRHVAAPRPSAASPLSTAVSARVGAAHRHAGDELLDGRCGPTPPRRGPAARRRCARGRRGWGR